MIIIQKINSDIIIAEMSVNEFPASIIKYTMI